MISMTADNRIVRKARKARHLFDALDNEFRRLADEWEPETIPEGKYRKTDRKIADTSFVLDLNKAVSVIDALKNSLGGHWDERIIRHRRMRVVQEHPVITQLTLLSDALSTLAEGYIPAGVPQKLKKLGNRLTEQELSFVKNLYVSARIIQQSETDYRKAKSQQLLSCDLNEACQILAEKILVEFKGANLDGDRLYRLFFRHRAKLDW